MEPYPQVVTTIVDDYLSRVKSQLRPLPPAESDEFLREIRSHLYEAYCEAPEGDDVARILTVLRGFGEPSEVVADRLPRNIVRTGARRALPLYIAGGLVLALFGIPLGLGGIAVLLEILMALAALLLAYYAVSGAVLVFSAMWMALGLARIYEPTLYDTLIRVGHVQITGPAGELLDQLSPPGQGFLFVLLALALGALGVGMLRLGKRFARGLRFLSVLIFDWFRRRAQAARQRIRDRRAHRDQGLAWRLSVSR